MGRHAQGWVLRCPAGRTVYLVRFQHEGRTVERSTGERDRGAAAKRAAEIYAEVVSGRSGSVVAPTDILEDFGSWLADYALTHTAGTAATVEGYAKTLLSHFTGYDAFTGPSYADFMRTRIGQVSRSTLRKELSALRMFVAWARVERSFPLPDVPGVPKRGHPGVRSPHARRRQATILTPEEVAAILAHMPERAPRSGTWVRPFFELMWQTALRPYSTLARLEVPLHYRKGAETLFVSREIDKARYERTIPLNAAARTALDAVCPAEGSVFPGLDKSALRASLSAAVRRAGITRAVSIYDFRHSRISHLANSGAPLAGVAFLVGHLHISTTAIYVHASQAAARAALTAAE